MHDMLFMKKPNAEHDFSQEEANDPFLEAMQDLATEKPKIFVRTVLHEEIVPLFWLKGEFASADKGVSGFGHDVPFDVD